MIWYPPMVRCKCHKCCELSTKDIRPFHGKTQFDRICPKFSATYCIQNHKMGWMEQMDCAYDCAAAKGIFLEGRGSSEIGILF
jgi:hypothetical protein